MRPNRSLLLCVAISIAAMAFDACHPYTQVPPAAMPVDSIVGMPAIVGTSFEHRLVLHVNGRDVALVAESGDSAALARLAGVETVVRGEKSGDSSMRVASFTALRVDGAPVVDGVLSKEGDRIFVNTAGGLLVIGNPPSAFTDMISARLWIGGPLDTGPNTYGVIIPSKK